MCLALPTLRCPLVIVAVLLLSLPSAAQPPDGYYDTIDDSSAATLRVTLHDVVDDHTRFPYTDDDTDTWDIINLADEDPNQSANIIDI